MPAWERPVSRIILERAQGNCFGAAPINAGTYTVVATYAASQNYTSVTAQATFVISPAAPTVTVNAPGRAYTGSVFAATGSVTGINGVSLATPTFKYYSGSSASGKALSAAQHSGTYTVVGSYAATTDYAAATAQVTFVITQAIPIVHVADAGGTYTGTAYAATGSVTGVNGASLGTPTFTYYTGSTAMGTALSGAPVNPGTYTVVASYAGSTDYTSATAQTTFVVSPATPTVTVADAGGSFTGSPFPASGSVTGLKTVSLGTPTFTYYLGSERNGNGLERRTRRVLARTPLWPPTLEARIIHRP